MNLKSLEAFGLSDVVLPVVGSLCVFGRVLDANSFVCIHVALHGLELDVAALHHRRVVEVNGLLYAPAAQEPVGTSGIAHDHGKVPFIHSGHADF